MNFQEELKRELMTAPTKKEFDKARKAEERLAREQAWEKRKKELEPEARNFIENTLYSIMKEIVLNNRQAHYAGVVFSLEDDNQVIVSYHPDRKRKTNRRYVHEKIGIDWDVVRTAKELAEDYNITSGETKRRVWSIGFGVKIRE